MHNTLRREKTLLIPRNVSKQCTQNCGITGTDKETDEKVNRVQIRTHTSTDIYDKSGSTISNHVFFNNLAG